MVILRDSRRLELRIQPHNGYWQATFVSFTPGHLCSTLYLLENFLSPVEAQEALQKKWRRLFPDDPPLQWHDSPAPAPSHRLPRHRQQEGPRSCC